MEVQLTDFENTAFIIFVVLLTRVILSFELNFYTPLSLVDDNMKRAHQRGAVTEGKFHFRKHITNGMYISCVALVSRRKARQCVLMYVCTYIWVFVYVDGQNARCRYWSAVARTTTMPWS